MQNLDLTRGVLYRRRGDPEINLENENGNKKIRSNSSNERSESQKDIYIPDLSLTEENDTDCCDWVKFYTIIKCFKVIVGENVVGSSEFDDIDLICSNLNVQIHIGNSDFLEKEPLTVIVPVKSVLSVEIHQLEINEDKTFNKIFFEINSEEFGKISNQMNHIQSSKNNDVRKIIKISTNKVLSENFKCKMLKIFGNKLKFVTLYQPGCDLNKIEKSQTSCLTEIMCEIVPILENSTEISTDHNKKKAESQNVPSEIIEISDSDSESNGNLKKSDQILNQNPNDGKKAQNISKNDQSSPNLDQNLQIKVKNSEVDSKSIGNLAKNLENLKNSDQNLNQNLNDDKKSQNISKNDQSSPNLDQNLQIQVKNSESESDSNEKNIFTKNCQKFIIGKYVESILKSKKEKISVSISAENFGIVIDDPEYFDKVSKLKGRKVSFNIPLRKSSIQKFQNFYSSIQFELNYEECVKIMNELGITELHCWSWKVLGLDEEIFSKFFKIVLKFEDPITQDEAEKLEILVGQILLSKRIFRPESSYSNQVSRAENPKICSIQPDEMSKMSKKNWISINCSNFTFRKFKCRGRMNILLDILSDKFVFHFGPIHLKLEIYFSSLENFQIFEQENQTRLEFLFNPAEILKITRKLKLKVEYFAQAYNVIKIWTIRPLSPAFVERLKKFLEKEMAKNSTKIQKICSSRSSSNEKETSLFKKIPVIGIKPFNNIPWKDLTSCKPSPTVNTKNLKIFSKTCTEPSALQNEEMNIIKSCYMVKIGAKIVSENLDSSLAAAERKITLKISQNLIEINVVVSKSKSKDSFSIFLPCDEISNMKIDKFSGNSIFNFELYPDKHLEIRNQFNLTTEEFSEDKEGTKYIKVFTREELHENYFGIMGVIFNNKLAKLNQNSPEIKSNVSDNVNKDNFVQSSRSKVEPDANLAEKINENTLGLSANMSKPESCQNNQKISSTICDNFSDFPNSLDNFGSVSESNLITGSKDQCTGMSSESCHKTASFAKYLREYALENASKLFENDISQLQPQPQPGPSQNCQKLSSCSTISSNNSSISSNISNFFDPIPSLFDSILSKPINQNPSSQTSSTGRSSDIRIFQESSTSKSPLYREKSGKNLSIWTNKGFLVKIGEYLATAINEKSNANDKIHLIITEENVTIDFHTFDSNLTGKPENIKFTVDSVQSVKIYKSNNNNMIFFELNSSTSDRIREEFNLHISNYSTSFTEDNSVSENLEARYIKIFISSTLQSDFLRTVSGIFGLKLKFINHKESEFLNGFKKVEKISSLFLCNAKVYIYPCFKMYFGTHMIEIEDGGCQELHLYPGNGNGTISLGFERKSQISEKQTRKSFEIPNDKNINFFYAIENKLRMIFFIELKQDGFKFIQDIFNFLHNNNDINTNNVKKYPGFDPLSTSLEKKYIILLFDSRDQIVDIEKLQIDIFETFQYKCQYMTGHEIAINLFKFIDTT